MVYLGDGWGDVVLPSPGSEPPPPYSPPRVPHHHQHFFPQAFASSPHNHHHHPPHHYYHNHISDYYDVSPTRSSQPSSLTLSTTGSVHPHESLLDNKSMKDPPPPYPPTPFKSSHPALNHGPSSAFSPPTKSIKYSYPPPYTPWTDTKNTSLVSSPTKASSPPPVSVTSTFTTTPNHAQPHSDLGRSERGHTTITSPRNRTGREHHQLQNKKSRSLEHGESRRHHRVNGSHSETRSSSGSHTSRSHQVRGHNGNIGCVTDTIGHPKGPLLKTGKSLELPHERLSSYHHLPSAKQNHRLHPHHSAPQAHHRIPATAHIHPGHSSHHHHFTKDLNIRQTKEPHGIISKSNKLAYVGILPSKPNHSKHVREREIRPCEWSRNPHTFDDRLKEPPMDCKKMRYDDRWVRRTSRLEAAAAQSMMPVRAIPVTAISGPTPPNAFRRNEYGRDYEEGSLSRGRLRSYRSLDELSDLLDEDLTRLPVATTRSLDDLTEPVYENLDVINAHARSLQNARIAHNTSVPDLLDPPPRPPRQRNSSLSSLLDDLVHGGASNALSRRTLNTSVPDVLERGMGARAGERGVNGICWDSPSSTLRSASSTLRSNVSTTSTLRSTTQEADNTSDIGVQLQKIREVARVLGVKYRNGELSSSSGSSSMAPSTHTSPRMPNPTTHTMPLQAPGVPARAPVIHDVLRDARKSSPQQTEADVASQESGYSSMDSRSCKQQMSQYQQSDIQQASSQYTMERIDSSSTTPERSQLLKHFSEQDNRSAQYVKKQSSEQAHIKPTEISRTNNHAQQQKKQREQLGCKENMQFKNSLSVYRSEEKRNSSSLQPSPSKETCVSFRHHLPQTQQQPNNSLQEYHSSQQVPQRHLSEFPIQQLEKQQGVNQDKLGIYIKSVVPGGAADQDGRLQAGDQLLTVDGKSLIGITQERAAEYMMETGPVVTLEVARQGAIYHGLATILSQPSPQANRASLRKMRPRTEETTRAAMTNSQSTPNMGGYNERLVDWNQPPRQHPLPPTSSHNSLLARSSPNLAAPAEGYPGGRHLSERDLPSKVLREHNQEPPSHPHQAPRMQSSKSVPSLNSDAGSSVGGKAASLEVFNPSYSRTSSNTSLSQPPSSHVPHHQHPHLQQQQQQHQPPIRSRSIQNLSDGSYQGAVGRHPSNPNLVVEEERYYQNVNFHQGTQDPRMGSTRTRPAQPLPMSSPVSQGPSEQQRTDHFRSDPRTEHRPASAFMQREDMMPHRTDLQRPASQRDIRADAKMIEMTEEVRRREDRMRLNGHAVATSQQRSGSYQPSHRLPNAPYPSVGTSFPSEGYGGPQGFPGQHQGYHPAASQSLSPQTHVAGLQPPPQHAHSQYPGQPHGFPGKHPPPTAPKPKSQVISQTPLSPEAPEKPSRQYGYDGVGIGIDGPPRPPPPEDGYRDSPPPPPPPTSTHPLLQGSRPTSSVGYTSTQLPNKSVFSSSSPWDREEKDRNDRRRREAVRHWRDEQISSLEALELRTSQQDERLRTLRLEKEFQRRAEEALSNDDDDDDDEDEDDDIKETNENDKVNVRHGPEAMIRDENKPPASAPVIPLGQEPRMNGGGPIDDERARRVDEIRRKQQELEAASEVEERLLREAQRRQQEEQMRQKQQQTTPSQHLHYQHQHHASQRLDSLVATPFQSQYNNGPVNGMRGSSHGGYQEHIGVTPENRNRMDSVVSGAQHSPVPPERGSSYTIMQQQTPSSSTANTRFKGTDSSSATIKRVQFSETPAVDTHITYDSNANQEKNPQDPNNFINEAETLLNSSPTRSVGGTPGVIGAQEVYRDPRMRRLQQKEAEQAAAKNPGPEKLTFKEKMKMFAMETGEGETPKDKVKISRAQRDIEH